MVDLIAGSRGSVFTVLDAGVSLAPVHDTVKQDTKPPFVMIDEIEWENEGSKAEPLLKITLKVATVYRGGDRDALLAIMHEIYTAVAGGVLSADGIAFDTPSLVAGYASTAGPDGVTFAGIQTFEFYAEPA